MTTSRPTQPAAAKYQSRQAAAKRTEAPAPQPPQRAEAVPGFEEPAAPAATETGLPDVPYSAEDQGPVAAPREEPEAAPPPKEHVVLNGLASYGPVRIGGKLVRTVKGKLYHVPDVEERADILGTGRFRAATTKDVQQLGYGSAGKGGALTVQLLPEGAIKKNQGR